MKRRSNLLFLLPVAALFAVFYITSCRDKSKNIPDVSDITVDFQINRFEQDLFSLDTNALASGLEMLQSKYPDFYSVYFVNLLGAYDERLAPSGPESYIRGFMSDERIRKLHDTCQVVYADFSPFKSEYEKAFKFLKYYFPDKSTPEITTYFSEYIIGALIYDEGKLAVGLDFFLGAEYPYAQLNPGNPNFSSYLTRTFTSDYLVARTLMPMVEDMAGPEPGQKLLDLMVHQGKKRYVLERLLPMHPDTVIFEHSPAQMKWLENNELEMWAFFLDQDFLYSNRQKDIRKFVEPSPNSPGMPQEAPGNAGTWMGYRIITTYMERYPDTSLSELLAMRDAQKILTASRYKPVR